jgi:hypothetical protein
VTCAVPEQPAIVELVPQVQRAEQPAPRADIQWSSDGAMPRTLPRCRSDAWPIYWGAVLFQGQDIKHWPQAEQ